MSAQLTRSRTYGVQRGVEVPMRDGTILCADVWLPEGEGPFPVLLERLPYDRSSSFMAHHIVGLEALRAVDAGFAVVVQDTRGRFGSGGEFVPFLSEAQDGADTVRWVCEQAFSDGRVGMFGASYIGATQLLAASRAPEGLLAIAPQLTASNYHDGWTYRGGALELGFVLLWIIEALAAPDVLRRDFRAREAAERVWLEMAADPTAAFASLPVDRDDLALLAPYARDWLRHPAPDAYWAQISPADAFGRMDVAGLHIAGWYDIFLESGLRGYAGLRAGAATEWAREHQYLVVGPWSHGNPSDWQGDRWLGYPAAAAGFDLTALHLEFFAATLERRGPDLPRVQLFTTGIDRWRTADDWPVPGARASVLHLHGDGRLDAAPPSAEDEPDSFVSDPHDPVPTRGGASFLPGLLLGRNSGPMRQEAIEGRNDVLVYTGAPLQADLEVTGEVVLELYAASEGTDCDWTARLVDVHPDGAAYGLVDGILRARYRHGLDRPEPLTPGRPEVFRVVVGSLSHVFRAGHRLRLQVASSNFPRFDRNPQQFTPVHEARTEEMRVVRQTLFHDTARPSRLLLPVLG